MITYHIIKHVNITNMNGISLVDALACTRIHFNHCKLHDYKHKSLSIHIHTLLYPEIPYYGKESLTIEGNPSLPYYIKKSFTI